MGARILSLVGLCSLCAGVAGFGAYLLFAKDRTVNPPIDGYTATLEVTDLKDPQKSCTDYASSDFATAYSRDDSDCEGKRQIYIFHGSSEITVLDPQTKTYWKGKPVAHLSVHSLNESGSHKGFEKVDGYLFELKQFVTRRASGEEVLNDQWLYAGSVVSFSHEHAAGRLFRVKRFSAEAPDASSFTVPGDYREVPMPA